MLLAKNILSKFDINKIDFKPVLEGNGIELPPFKILDIGCGFGKWGFLIRDYFEVLIGQKFNKEDWKIDIIGVEPFKKCITKIQKELYNEIIQKDIFEVLNQLNSFDLIIMGDVIEHIEKEKAHKLLKKLFKHSKNILISTPLGFMPQGAWAGNEKEIHKSGWKLSDFKQYNIVEHKILSDEFSSEIFKSFPNLPQELNSKIKLLVIWLKE